MSLALNESDQRERKSCVQNKRRWVPTPIGLAQLLELRTEWCQASKPGAYLKRLQKKGATSEKWSQSPQTDSSREASTSFPRSHSPGDATGAVDVSAAFDI